MNYESYLEQTYLFHWDTENIITNAYGKCSKFLAVFSYRMLGIKAGIRQMLVRIANEEDPDQTASSEAVWSGFTLFVKAFYSC